MQKIGLRPWCLTVQLGACFGTRICSTFDSDIIDVSVVPTGSPFSLSTRSPETHPLSGPPWRIYHPLNPKHPARSYPACSW
eukprot:2287770-Pyramimonas_sp.AAC.2